MSLKRALLWSVLIGGVFGCIMMQVGLSLDDTWQKGNRSDLLPYLFIWSAVHWPIHVLIERSSGSSQMVLIIVSYWVLVWLAMLLIASRLRQLKVRKSRINGQQDPKPL